MKANRSSKARIAAWCAGILFAVCLLSVGIAYACGYFDPDPRIEELRALTAKLTDGGIKPEKLLDKKNWDLIAEMRKKVEALPPDLKKQVEAEGRSQFETMVENHMKDVLGMKPAEQQAQLDKDLALIQVMTLFRTQRDPQATGDKNAAAGSTGNPPAATGGGGQAAPPGGAMSDADRAKRRNRYLSSVPAATRAAQTTYFQLLKARADTRGIALPPMMGGR